MTQKKLVTCLFISKGKLYADFKAQQLVGTGDVLDTARLYSDSGIDHLYVFDLSKNEYEHEEAISFIKQMARIVEVPISAGGNINRLEDVKKYLYAGCAQVILNSNKPSTAQMAEESAKRFGKKKIAISLENVDILFKHRTEIEENVAELIVLNEEIIAAVENITELPFTPILNHVTLEQAIEVLEKKTVKGIASAPVRNEAIDIMEVKNALKQKGISVMTLETSIKWEDFKLNAEGLIPVITQDYRTNEVLMLAYMNEEAFHTTLTTGKMTYFSRSRNELWTKGLTSGHLQYVKSLTLDCDNDTILAKISQVGAACHTGRPSCFFQELVKKEYNETNPLKVFENVYQVILDRKENPKEGSYTNYLFDKGIDKILKKIGEEATEIVIAAKNPDPEEIKYEISDFLYHTMVLMAEKGVTWEDVTSELAQR